MKKSQEELSTADICIEIAKSKRQSEIETLSRMLNRISNKIVEIVTIIFNELENEEDKKEIIRKWESQKDILEQLTERNNNK